MDTDADRHIDTDPDMEADSDPGVTKIAFLYFHTGDLYNFKENQCIGYC